MADAQAIRTRFFAEMAMMTVAVGTMLVNIYQATLASTQFHSSQQQLAEVRKALMEDRRASARPVLVPKQSELSWPTSAGQESNKPTLQLINIGKGIALDVTVDWQIIGLSAERSEPSFLMPQETARLSNFPFNEVLAAAVDAPSFAGSTKKLATGVLWIKCKTVDGEHLISEQHFDASVEPNSQQVAIRFTEVTVSAVRPGEVAEPQRRPL